MKGHSLILETEPGAQCMKKLLHSGTELAEYPCLDLINTPQKCTRPKGRLCIMQNCFVQNMWAYIICFNKEIKCSCSQELQAGRWWHSSKIVHFACRETMPSTSGEETAVALLWSPSLLSHRAKRSITAGLKLLTLYPREQEGVTTENKNEMTEF